uniref:PX domain-containing protein n=1 Tax=Rhizophagus irregularis (strain DAOM 181602 / DAOM 197198 / MUCL 43194) TaxID=747089 RepID=U9SHW7_RHIID
MSTMTSLIIEVPVMIGAIEFTRMILFDPLAKIAFPYFKTVENEVNGYTTYLKYITAVTFYYLLVNNFLLLPLYFLQIFIGFILVFTILCNFTPLWEIFMTSFKFTDFYSIFTMEKTSIVENFNNVMMGELIINSKQQQQQQQRNLQLDIYSNLKKKNFQFNQNFQPDAIIVMNADILVKLNRLLSIPTHKSKPTHYQTYRKHRSRNMNFLPTYYSNEKLSIPRRRKNSNLLICDSQDQFKSSDNLKEIHVAPPSDLFLSEKINELDKKLVDLTEHENLARKLIKQQNNPIKLMDVTKLSIPAFTVKQEIYKKFAVYIIMVQRIDASTGKAKAGWIVPRRYNEFSSLNQQLKNHYSEFVDKFEFPGKTLFNSLNNTFLESRRVQLENYLQGLLSNDEICEDRDFLKFLSKEN